MTDKWIVATFNANSLRLRMPQVIEWLGRVRPNVLAIQETKVQDHQFPLEEIEAAGYHAIFAGQKELCRRRHVDAQ